MIHSSLQQTNGEEDELLVFPSGVKEDLARDPGCCSSLCVKEDQLSWVLYCPYGDCTLVSGILSCCSGTGRRTPKERRSEPG
ncbi:hypothetical protein Taro_031324 [Colocasia esculenta]|uniref:Uncharacterized protein n=1 Tax=Colocasia esculenta TaxID=4460 RepID=A0A843W2U1_COLES|nr:hypothetical protein [Colocasia esculenta]